MTWDDKEVNKTKPGGQRGDGGACNEKNNETLIAQMPILSVMELCISVSKVLQVMDTGYRLFLVAGPLFLQFLGASFTKGTVSSIPIVGSISLEGFLPPILLLVVIIAWLQLYCCGFLVVVVVGECFSIIKLPVYGYWLLRDNCVFTTCPLTSGVGMGFLQSLWLSKQIQWKFCYLRIPEDRYGIMKGRVSRGTGLLPKSGQRVGEISIGEEIISRIQTLADSDNTVEMGGP
ncbi:hypothetical protein Tco_0528492 [Tanacetum coccineum]